jgi:hypothetical protein
MFVFVIPNILYCRALPALEKSRSTTKHQETPDTSTASNGRSAITTEETEAQQLSAQEEQMRNHSIGTGRNRYPEEKEGKRAIEFYRGSIVN